MSIGRSWHARGFAALLLAAACVAMSVGMAQVPPPRALIADAVIDGPEETPLRWPVGLAVGAGGQIAVADAMDSRLVLFRREGAGYVLASSVALPEPPADVAFDGSRYVVALRVSGALVAIAPDGKLTQSPVLPAGVWVGRLAALPDGSLVVWDAAARRLIHVVGGAIAAEAACAETVTALAAAANGGFWVGVGRLGEVRRYDGAAGLVATWTLPAEGATPAWPAGIVEDGARRLFVADRNAGRVVVLDGEGRLLGVGSGRGWDPGRLLRPLGLARLADGRIVVGDQGNGRVQVFRVVESLK